MHVHQSLSLDIYLVFGFNWSTHSFAYARTRIAPEVTSNVALVGDQANAIVTLDWSNSFRFNGVLRYFIIARNNITLIQSPITRFVFNNEPTGISELPYSGKFSREKTFTNFAIFQPSAKVFSTKF